MYNVPDRFSAVLVQHLYVDEAGIVHVLSVSDQHHCVLVTSLRVKDLSYLQKSGVLKIQLDCKGREAGGERGGGGGGGGGST